MFRNLSELDLYVGAGDGNRTRTISLGICAVSAVTQPGLRCELSVSVRERSLFTEANGPLMARRGLYGRTSGLPDTGLTALARATFPADSGAV